MQKHNTLLKLSHQGKWITLARAWLENHVPVAMTEYFINVAPMMPKHISYPLLNRRYTDIELCKQALRRLPVNISDNVITSIASNKHRPSSDWANIIQQSTTNGVVNLEECGHKYGLDKKQIDCLRQWLYRNDYVNVARCTYAIKKVKP